MKITLMHAIAVGAMVAAGACLAFAPRVSACDGVYDLSCVINPVERLSASRTGTTAPDTDGATAEQAEPVGQPTSLRPERAARQAGPSRRVRATKTVSDRKPATRDEKEKNTRAEAPAGDDAAQDETTGKIQDRVATGAAAPAPAQTPSAQTPSAHDATDAAWLASRNASAGPPDTRAIWSSMGNAADARSATGPGSPEIVDASAFNDIDRRADETKAGERLAHTGTEQAAGADPRQAMAMMEPQDEPRAWWQDVLPLGETSVIGQIFVLAGGLLTAGTVLRMFLA